MEKVLFTWSGGKDSAMALNEIKMINDYQIVALITTITKDYDRISMHGVRSILLNKQADSLGLNSEKILITKNASNKEYEDSMKSMLMKYKNLGINKVIFGDIFLEDLRRYREQNLSNIGMSGIFPLWKRNTKELAIRFIELGFKAIITCVDSKVLNKKFVGKCYDLDFLDELPPDVDPCGENGEFHSFVYDGPIFQDKIKIQRGEVVLRDNRYYFCDLIPF